MLGTNDSKNWNEENYKTQMTAFYNEYKTENNKVIFATSPKCYQTTGNDITQEKVEKVYQAQKALIKENAAWDFIEKKIFIIQIKYILQMQDICT